MSFIFSKCSKAIEEAISTKGVGCFFSNNYDSDKNIHIHECCEILFCISGGKSFFIDDKIYEVNDGDIFVLNPFEAHKITYSKENIFQRYVLQIHPEFLYNISTPKTNLSSCFYMRKDNISHRISLSEAEKMNMINKFKELESDSDYADEIKKKMTITQIIIDINMLFLKQNSEHSYHTDYDNKTILTIINYINSNLCEPLTLELIAKNSFISVNELCRLFKKHMGTTVNNYIISKRITVAKKLLNKDLSVLETAERCGFADYANFIRVFKKAVGIPPGKYKKQILK